MFRLIKLPALILLVLLSLELIAETRHYLRGFSPLLLQWLSGSGSPAADPGSPEPGIPFAKQINNLGESSIAIKIWVASSSFALRGARQGKTFPYLVCSELSRDGTACHAVNGSRPGDTINSNLETIAASAPAYQPDYIVLYQLVNDINQFLKSGFSPASDENTTQTNSIIDFGPARRIIENTSLYGHLREYISGAVALQAPLDTRLDNEFDALYRTRLIEFIELSREVGATPVLTTFASSHVNPDIGAVPFKTRLMLMRYQQKLGVEGWILEIKRLNELLRQLAVEQGVRLIDLEPELAGKKELFSDFVHFNTQGHQKMGVEIAASLKLYENSSRPGFYSQVSDR